MATNNQTGLSRLQQLSKKLREVTVAEVEGTNASSVSFASAIAEILRDSEDAMAVELGHQFVEFLDDRDTVAEQRTGALPESDVMFIAGLARRLDGANSRNDALRRAISEAAPLVSATSAHVSNIGVNTFRPLLTFNPGRSVLVSSEGTIEVSFTDGDVEHRAISRGEPVATSDEGVHYNAGTRGTFGYSEYLVLPLAYPAAEPMLIHLELTSDYVLTASVRILLQVILDLYTIVVRRIEAESPLPRYRTLPALTELTAREREVLLLLLEGPSNAALAERLSISLDTVKSHVKSILSKLHAVNRAELIARFTAEDPRASDGD